MGQKINVTVNVQVVGGKNLSENQSLDVDVVGSIEVELDKKDGPKAKKSIEITPIDLKKIRFFMVTAKPYHSKVSYQINSQTPVMLDGPHVLIGAGAVSLLGKNSGKIEFANEGSEKTSITILIGRLAA